MSKLIWDNVKREQLLRQFANAVSAETESYNVMFLNPFMIQVLTPSGQCYDMEIGNIREVQ